MTEGSTENGTPEKKQRKKRVVLGNANGYVVQDHLRANLEFYKKEQFPIAVLCERLNRELGLTTVTEKNLRNNCIDAKFNLAEIVGPTPRKPRQPKPKPKPAAVKVSGSVVSQLAAQLLAVATETKRVCDAIAEPYNIDGSIDFDLLKKLAEGLEPDRGLF